MIARAKSASIRYYRGIMRKNSSTTPPAPQAKVPRAQRGPVPLHNLNPNLNQQTRKVLAQHYRAKYGVK